MHVVVDITHPCDINLFRAATRRWRSDGHEVELVYLDRGKVAALVAHEYPDFPARQVGRHIPSRLGLYLRTGLYRELELARALRGRRIDAVVGCPGFQTALVGKLLGARSLGTYDDPEHRPNMVLSKLFCDVLLLPECLGETGTNVRPLRALKEWAHLSPRYFTPNPAVLAEYGLEPGRYVFVREVEPRSLNYMDVHGQIIRSAYDAGLRDEHVVLSLEDKRRRDLFAGWQILEEPVSDLPSLLYYSKIVISSGDSMAREGAQLGVPSVYAGHRQMKANDALYAMGLMEHIATASAIVERARVEQRTETSQAAVRQRLLTEWEDVPEALTRALYTLMGEG